MILHDQLEPLWKGLHPPFILCICRVFSIESLQLFSFTDWIKNANTKFITFYSIFQAFFIKVQLNSFSPLAVKLSHIKIHYSSSVVFNLYARQPPNVFQKRQAPLRRVNLLTINMAFQVTFHWVLLCYLRSDPQTPRVCRAQVENHGSSCLLWAFQALFTLGEE